MSFTFQTLKHLLYTLNKKSYRKKGKENTIYNMKCLNPTVCKYFKKSQWQHTGSVVGCCPLLYFCFEHYCHYPEMWPKRKCKKSGLLSALIVTQLVICQHTPEHAACQFQCLNLPHKFLTKPPKNYSETVLPVGLGMVGTVHKVHHYYDKKIFYHKDLYMIWQNKT